MSSNSAYPQGKDAPVNLDINDPLAVAHGPTHDLLNAIAVALENYVGVENSTDPESLSFKLNDVVSDFLSHAQDGTLHGGGSAGAAKLTTALPVANDDLLYTADTPGTAGNNITITYVNPGTASAVLSVSVTGTAITVNLATDAALAITSTAAHVRDAVNAHTGASVLVNVTTATGNDGTGVVAALSTTALTGGVASVSLTSTARSDLAPTSAVGAGAYAARDDHRHSSNGLTLTSTYTGHTANVDGHHAKVHDFVDHTSGSARIGSGTLAARPAAGQLDRLYKSDEGPWYWDNGTTWIDVGFLRASSFVAKGSILIGTGAGTFQSKALGAEGTVPVVRASDATGIAFEALSDNNLWFGQEVGNQTIAWSGANDMKITPVFSPGAMTVNRLRIQVGGVGGTIAGAIYNASGSRLAMSAQVAANLNAVQTLSLTTNASVTPGKYFLGLWCDSGTAQFVHINRRFVPWHGIISGLTGGPSATVTVPTSQADQLPIPTILALSTAA